MTRCLAALACLSTILSAASNQARNRCSDATRILRSSSASFDLAKPIDPDRVNNAVGHYNQIVENWKRAGQQIGQIPKSELNPNDPDMRDCVTEAKKWGDYINKLAERIKEAQGAASVAGPLLDEVKTYEESFWRMIGAHFSTTDVLGQQPAEAKKVMDDMAAVAAICQSKAPQAGVSMPQPPQSPAVRNFGNVTVYTSIARSPDAWCYAAKNRQTLIAKALGQKVITAPGYGNWAYSLPDAQRNFENGKTSIPVSVALLMWDATEMKAAIATQLKAWYQAAGIDAPANAYPELDAKISAVRAAGAKAAAQTPFEDANFHDARIEAMGRAKVQKAEPSSKILKSTMDAAGFTVRTNSLGVPLERYRSGRVMIQRPRTNWCEARTFSYVEVHAGGGKYMPPAEAKLTEYTMLVKCP